MTRSFPKRSVTSIVSSGRKASANGYDNDLATATTRIRWPSAVSKAMGSGGSGWPARPSGATGMPPWKGTFCWPDALWLDHPNTSSATSAPMLAAARRELVITERPPGNVQYRPRVTRSKSAIDRADPSQRRDRLGELGGIERFGEMQLEAC